MSGDGYVNLHRVTLQLCELCLAGRGGECHSPGCALWINRAPDIPLAYAEVCDPPHPNVDVPYESGWNPYVSDWRERAEKAEARVAEIRRAFRAWCEVEDEAADEGLSFEALYLAVGEP